MSGRIKPDYVRPVDFRHGRVDMNHGAGGRAAAQLIEELFARAFDNPALRQGDDGALLDIPPGHRLVMATDGHVVSPLFFPGGDIGCLAVHGTVNDVAMLGAEPLYLSAGFILEEGFALADLQRIVASMAQAAREAGVAIVTGDTKVVQQGQGDGVFITTTGVGIVPLARRISGSLARPGDVVLLSGTIGDHGVAILSKRESLAFETEVLSDTASSSSSSASRRCSAFSSTLPPTCSVLPAGSVMDSLSTSSAAVSSDRLSNVTLSTPSRPRIPSAPVGLAKISS